MTDQPQHTEKRKVLDAKEFQKLGVIGVLIFMINFLMDNINTSDSKISEDISSINKEVAGLSVSNSVIASRVDLLTQQVEAYAGLMDKRYKSTDAEKDLRILQNQIDDLGRRLQLVENKP